jgi:phosphoglycolate phosphatase
LFIYRRTGIGDGMDTIGVTWGFRNREELESYNPKYVIDHPNEIIDIIKKSAKLNEILV